MYTAAAEAVGKWESRGVCGISKQRGKVAFDFSTLRLFHSFSRADFFTIVDPMPEYVFRDSRSATDVWLPVVADVIAESAFAVMVAPVMPGSPSRRSCVRDTGSPACHFPIPALPPWPAPEHDDNYPVPSAKIDLHSAPPNRCST